MKDVVFAILVALAAFPVWAASAPPKLRKTPNLAKNAEAYPTLVGATRAIARINRALQAANAKQREDMKDAGAMRRKTATGGAKRRRAAHRRAFRQLVGARQFVVRRRPSQSRRPGARFRSEHGRAGQLAKLLPAPLLTGPGRASDRAATPADAIASPALTALFIDESEKEGVGADCKEAFGQQEMNFKFWPDAKARGLAMRAAKLLHWAEGPCSGPVTISAATLKRLGFDALLIEDIETGRFQVAQP